MPYTSSVVVPVVSQRSLLLRLQRHRLTLLCACAVLGYFLLFIVLPYANVAVFSFWEKDMYVIRPALSLDNYERALTSPLYQQVVINSLEIAAWVTVISAILGYLLAYYLAMHTQRWRPILFFLLIVPLWTSFLLRAYIWKIVLGRNGILNSILLDLGILQEPSSILLYSQFSVVVALIYIFLPFVALPVYAALEKIPSSYLEASADLGAPPRATFLQIVLPLTLPALIAGATVVFCLSFGDFITPALLGGTDNLMIANVIISQFGSAFDWPFGSALAMVVLLVVLLLVALLRRIGQIAEGVRP